MDPARSNPTESAGRVDGPFSRRETRGGPLSRSGPHTDPGEPVNANHQVLILAYSGVVALAVLLVALSGLLWF